MEAHPVVIPVWLTGFDQLMPEGRKFPFNFLPRAGIDLSITFGEPIPAEELLDAAKSKDTSEDIIRSELTDVVKTRVELLGRSVSGLMLGQTKAPRSL
jgi:monolysocardiolipin acyltransferase